MEEEKLKQEATETARRPTDKDNHGDEIDAVSPRPESEKEDAETWGALADDLIVQIVKLIPASRADRFGLTYLNNHWQRVVHSRLPPLPSELPYLILPSSRETLFHTSTGSPDTTAWRRLYLHGEDMHNASFCGSFEGGWMAVAVLEPCKYQLYNIYTSQIIDLPITILRKNRICQVVRMEVIVMSASPSSAGYLLCAILHIDSYPWTSIALWNETCDHWVHAPCEEENGSLKLQDVLYQIGEFLVLSSQEDIRVIVPQVDQDGNLRSDYRMPRVAQRPYYESELRRSLKKPPMTDMRHYLVQSRDDLLMIIKYVYRQGGGVKGRTYTLKMFKLHSGPPPSSDEEYLDQAPELDDLDTDIIDDDGDLSDHEDEDLNRQELPGAMWLDLEYYLPGRILFVGRGSSRSFNTKEFENGLSGIHFLDDRCAQAPQIGHFLRSDMGVQVMFDVDHIDRWPLLGDEGLPSSSSDRFPPAWWLQHQHQ